MINGSYHTLDRLAQEITEGMAPPAEELLAALEARFAADQERFNRTIDDLRQRLARSESDLRMQRYANDGLLLEINNLRLAMRAKVYAKPKRKTAKAKKRSKK